MVLSVVKEYCWARWTLDTQIQWKGSLICFGLWVNSSPGCLTSRLNSSAELCRFSAFLLWRLHVIGFSLLRGSHGRLLSLSYMCFCGHYCLFLEQGSLLPFGGWRGASLGRSCILEPPGAAAASMFWFQGTVLVHEGPYSGVSLKSNDLFLMR